MGKATLSGPVAVDEERLEAAARNSAGEKSEQEDNETSRTRLLWALGSAELEKVASGSARQGLWLRDRKVIGKERSRFPGRGTVGEVRRGGRQGRRASDRVKKRVYTFRVRFGREKRAIRLPCIRLGLGDDRRFTSGSGDVSLAFFFHFCERQRKPCVFH